MEGVLPRPVSLVVPKSRSRSPKSRSRCHPRLIVVSCTLLSSEALSPLRKSFLVTPRPVRVWHDLVPIPSPITFLPAYSPITRRLGRSLWNPRRDRSITRNWSQRPRKFVKLAPEAINCLNDLLSYPITRNLSGSPINSRSHSKLY